MGGGVGERVDARVLMGVDERERICVLKAALVRV